ncbi:hypothetical protein BSLG_004831 [Batrachochytrium salamandrivorans]|nr:hypothetical protein BSLG_004831 [Batrachochytrium salamandrivorans]
MHTLQLALLRPPSSAVGSTSASLQMEQAKSSFSAHVAAVFRAAETQHPWLLASNVRLVCKLINSSSAVARMVYLGST